MPPEPAGKDACPTHILSNSSSGGAPAQNDSLSEANLNYHLEKLVIGLLFLRHRPVTGVRQDKTREDILIPWAKLGPPWQAAPIFDHGKSGGRSAFGYNSGGCSLSESRGSVK